MKPLLFSLLVLATSLAWGQKPGDYEWYRVNGVTVPSESVPPEVRRALMEGKWVGTIPAGAMWVPGDAFQHEGRTYWSAPYHLVLRGDPKDGLPARPHGKTGSNGGYSLYSGTGENDVGFAGRYGMTGPGGKYNAEIARGLVAASTQIDIFNGARESWVTGNVEASLKRFRAESQNLKQRSSDLTDAQKNYADLVVKTASSKVAEGDLQKFAENAQNIGEKMKKEQAAEKAPPSKAPRTTQDAASDELRAKAILLTKAKDPKAIWKELRDFWRMQNGELVTLTPKDAAAVSEIYHVYVDSDGIVNEQVVGVKFANVCRDVGRALRTAPDSEEGRAVRQGVNDTLVDLSTETEKGLVQRAIMRLAFYLGADGRYADAEGRELGNRLLRIADVGVMFTPAGPAVVAGHLLSGIVTGYDLLGNRMEMGDYLLRGAEAALTILPKGTIAAAGDWALSKANVIGAKAIRMTGLGPWLAQTTKKMSSELVKANVQLAYKWAQRYTRSVSLETLEKLGVDPKVMRELEHLIVSATLTAKKAGLKAFAAFEKLVDPDAAKVAQALARAVNDGKWAELVGAGLPPQRLLEPHNAAILEEFRAAKGIPKDWEVSLGRENGIIFSKPGTKKADYVRFEPGDPKSPYPTSQVPYIRTQKNGQALDADGKVLPNPFNPEAHIPVNDFKHKP